MVTALVVTGTRPNTDWWKQRCRARSPGAQDSDCHQGPLSLRLHLTFSPLSSVGITPGRHGHRGRGKRAHLSKPVLQTPANGQQNLLLVEVPPHPDCEGLLGWVSVTAHRCGQQGWTLCLGTPRWDGEDAGRVLVLTLLWGIRENSLDHRSRTRLGMR